MVIGAKKSIKFVNHMVVANMSAYDRHSSVEDKQTKTLVALI